MGQNFLSETLLFLHAVRAFLVSAQMKVPITQKWPHLPPLFVLLIGVEMIETPTVPSSVCPLSTLGHTLHAVPTNRTFVCLIPLSFVLFTWSVSQSNLCKTISCRDVFYVQRVPIAY